VKRKKFNSWTKFI